MCLRFPQTVLVACILKASFKCQQLATFRYDYEYLFHYEYDFSDFELVMLTTRCSTIVQVNRRTATVFDPTKILRTPVKNLVVPRSRTRNQIIGR